MQFFVSFFRNLIPGKQILNIRYLKLHLKFFYFRCCLQYDCFSFFCAFFISPKEILYRTLSRWDGREGMVCWLVSCWLGWWFGLYVKVWLLVVVQNQQKILTKWTQKGKNVQTQLLTIQQMLSYFQHPALCFRPLPFFFLLVRLWFDFGWSFYCTVFSRRLFYHQCFFPLINVDLCFTKKFVENSWHQLFVDILLCCHYIPTFSPIM